MTTTKQLGQWQTQAYESGTTIVRTPYADEPWLYVVIVQPIDETLRYRICDDLAAWMNGGVRPRWMDDMERVSEIKLQSLDGLEIEAVGPMYDADPPNLNWRTCEDDASRWKRRQLVNWLCQ